MGSKTKQLSLKDLDLKLNNLTTQFTEELSKFKKELKQKSSDDDNGDEITGGDLYGRFEKFEDLVNTSLKNLNLEINAIKNSHDKLSKNIDSHLQTQNNNKIICYGYPEKENENLIVDISDLLNEKLQVNIQQNDIFNCYRLGAKKLVNTNGARNNKPRPVIIEFTTMWKRNEIYKNKSLLKGSKLIFSEVLTPNRYKLLQEAKELYQKDCWVRNGRIIINKNNKKHYISDSVELHNIRNQV